MKVFWKTWVQIVLRIPPAFESLSEKANSTSRLVLVLLVLFLLFLCYPCRSFFTSGTWSAISTTLGGRSLKVPDALPHSFLFHPKGRGSLSRTTIGARKAQRTSILKKDCGSGHTSPRTSILTRDCGKLCSYQKGPCLDHFYDPTIFNVDDSCHKLGMFSCLVCIRGPYMKLFGV